MGLAEDGDVGSEIEDLIIENSVLDRDGEIFKSQSMAKSSFIYKIQIGDSASEAGIDKRTSPLNGFAGFKDSMVKLFKYGYAQIRRAGARITREADCH